MGPSGSCAGGASKDPESSLPQPIRKSAIMRRVFTLVLPSGGLLLCLAAERTTNDACGRTVSVTKAALSLLATVTDQNRALLQFEFDAEERTRWKFTPGDRPGLCLLAMNDDERRQVHALLRAALSTRGYLKACGIMELELVLREMEEAPHRDPERYWVAIFGSPDDLLPWGWRFEGHHLSLNFTCVGDRAVYATPAFFGASPAEVKKGRRAGYRALGAEQDLAFGLLESLDETQRATAVLAEEVPPDIYLSPESTGPGPEPRGLPAAAMDEGQRAILTELIAEFTHNLCLPLAETCLQRILDQEMRELRFCWIGSVRPGEPHYYRIQGISFAIELDNVQDGNHIHALWSDLSNAFGRSALLQHRQAERTGR